MAHKFFIINFCDQFNSYLNLQERKEDYCFDTQKLANWFHWFQSFCVGAIEKHQTVHGNKLGQVIYSNHVRKSYVCSEFTFPIYSVQFTNTEKSGNSVSELSAVSIITIEIIVCTSLRYHNKF